TLVSPLSDQPLDLKQPNGKRWQPLNYDKKFHGVVPLHEALTQSYNVAAAHLGLELGLPLVTTMVKRLGVSRPLPEVPALLLGAGELSPLEVAAMYQTIAARGVSAGLRSIRGISAANGTPLARYPHNPQQVVPATAVHLLHYAMQQTM